MKLKVIIIFAITFVLLSSVSAISADSKLEEGLYVTVNAIDNHIYQDTDNNRIDFTKEEVKSNSNIFNYIYSNGEYSVSLSPDIIEIEYVGNTEATINNHLNLTNGNDWMTTITPYSLVYEFTYSYIDEDASEHIYSVKETIYVTVEEQLTLTEKYNGQIFDPSRISRAIVRLVGLNFTHYSTTEKYYSYVCDVSSSGQNSSDNSELSCGISYSEYIKISSYFSNFVRILFSVVLGFSTILIIFRFVKSFFDTNPNQNNFRLANVVKRLGTLGFILALMLFLDNIMLFIVQIFSIVTVSIYDLVNNSFNLPATVIDNGLKNALDYEFAKLSLMSLITGKIYFHTWLIEILVGPILNIVFLGFSIYVILKVALIMLERMTIIIISVILSPIFIGYYIEPEKKKVASNFFSKFFASLFSAIILLLISIIFIFLIDIFMSIIKIAFSDLLNLDSDYLVTRTVIIVAYLMLMFFYVKTVTKANDLSEELLIINS